MNYYNDNDCFAVQWLRKLIHAGDLPPGTVDDSSIADVDPAGLGSFRACHFFAGIGGWPLALALAGWPADREIWTGSCPCQPFSAAGRRRGVDDERHLWPAFLRLIAERRPATVVGEQVASLAGREWLTGVRADLEALGYAVGAADLCAASVGEEAQARLGYEDHSFRWDDIVLGAPHIRQRLFWVADAMHSGLSEWRASARNGPTSGSGTAGGLGDAAIPRLEERQSGRRDDEPQRTPAERDGGAVRRMADAQRNGWRPDIKGRRPEGRIADFWANAEWLLCLDGKARRIEPGSFPLAHGVPARVGRLRGYGNAIVPQVAAVFVRAFLDI